MQLVLPPKGFQKAEYQQRLTRAQQMMQQQQLAGVLLTTEHDIHYFTGFYTQFWQSPTRPWYVVLPASGKPIAIIPEIGVNCMRNGWVEDIRSWSSPHAKDDGVSLLIEVLSQVANQSKQHTIGINRGRETYIRMSLNELEQVQATLPNAKFGDATAIIRKLRMVKSQAEIAKLYYVAQQVSGVFERLPEFISTGMSDEAIFRAFKIECLQAGVDVSYLVGATGQNGYNDIISPPGDKQLQAGDVLILDTGCIYDGYFCDFDRNYGFGSIDSHTQRAYETVWQATEVGLTVAKPGITCKDLFTAMHEVLQKGGAQGDNVGRYGHGLGLQLTEPPSHTHWDTTILEPGMVLTLEPGMVYSDNKMMVHEENIVITETGVELLSRRAPSTIPCVK